MASSTPSSSSTPSPYILPPQYTLSRSPSLALSSLTHIYALLQSDTVYWGKDRSIDTVGKQVERSWSFLMILYKENGFVGGENVGKGEEEEGEVVGIARVVSDGIGMGYLCDVVISPLHTKKGLAKYLVREACNNTPSDADADGVEGSSKGWKWFLWTKDAHKIYESEGFGICSTDGGRVSDGWAMDRW